MSVFNYNKTTNFINKNIEFLKTLEKFRLTNTLDEIINVMKITKTDVEIILKLFPVLNIPIGPLFCNAMAAINHANMQLMEPGEFIEFHFDRWKGTMFFTSNYNTGNTNRNLGGNFNISIVSSFLGEYDNNLGRILMFRNNKQLHLLDLGDNSFQGRRLFSSLMTKLILGKDYNLEKINDDFTNLSKRCLRCNCSSDCVCGIWSGYGTLPEFVINYLFEIYCYDNQSLIDGIVSMDSSYDNILNKEIIGTEYKIFLTDKHMILESVIYMGIIYYNSDEYYKKIKEDYENYKRTGVNIEKNWSEQNFIELLNYLNYYANYARNDNNRNENVFNIYSVISSIGIGYGMRGGRKKYRLIK